MRTFDFAPTVSRLSAHFRVGFRRLRSMPDQPSLTCTR